MYIFFGKYKKFITVFLSTVFAVLLVVVFCSIAPSDFPSGQIISINKDMTVSEAAEILAQNNIIRFALVYKIYVALLDKGQGVLVGDYLFQEPQSSLRIAYRTVNGIQGLQRVKITVKEGTSSYDLAKLLTKNIPGFNSKEFLELAKKQEGYLFPDTYYFNPNVKPEDVVTEMKGVFEKKIASIDSEIKKFGQSISDVVKMASIVEKEASNENDRKIVAGILWKRIEAGMPLQVDPPFYYFLNKTSEQLTLDDLKVKSPYNLYLNKGLPPTAIDNPGLDAILATINPTETKYWFYLSDSKGNMHYAVNHDGHLINKEKYLP